MEGRSPAIRAVDRFVLVVSRSLRMNGLWPGHALGRRYFVKIVAVDYHLGANWRLSFVDFWAIWIEFMPRAPVAKAGGCVDAL